MVEQHGIAGGAHVAEPRMLHLPNHAACDDLRMREHLGEIVDPRAGHAHRHQRRFEVLRHAFAHRRLDDRDQRVLVGLAFGISGKACVGEMRVEPEHLHQLGEQRVVRCAESDVAAVAGLEQLIGCGEAMAVAERLRGLAGLQIFRRFPRRRRDCGLDQRDVGDATFAVACRADKAGERGIGRKQCAEHVRRLYARPHRHLAGLAGDGQDAGERLDDQVDSSAPPLRSALPKARHRGVDDARIDLLHLRGTEAELVERARPRRLQEYVRLRRKLEQDIDRLRPLEIEHQAALVAVERGEAHALALADRRCGAAHVALRRLDLDDIRAHVGEQRAGERPSDEVRELDDADSRKRLCHFLVTY